MPPQTPPASLFPLILNLLKDGRQDFQIPRDFPYRPPAILQQVQDERMGGNRFKMSGWGQPVQDERMGGGRKNKSP